MPNRVLAGIVSTVIILAICHTLLVRAAPETLSSEEIRLSRNDQQLTAHIKGVSLREVLQVLADQLAATITLKGFTGENRLSRTFTDLPLEQGVEQILQGYDYALLYSKANSFQQTRIKEIIILPRQDLSTHSTFAKNRVVMLPTKHLQELSEDQEGPYFKNHERGKLESTELADKVKALVRLSHENLLQNVSLLSQATNDQVPEIRLTAFALLKELESLSETSLQE